MAIDWDDLLNAPLMSADMFGEADQPVYTPAGGGTAFPIDGVFDDAFKRLDPMGPDGPEISTTDPVVGVRLAQFPIGSPPTQGGQLLIPRTGLTYLVRNVRPDGKGWALLDLNLKA